MSFLIFQRINSVQNQVSKNIASLNLFNLIENFSLQFIPDDCKNEIGDSKIKFGEYLTEKKYDIKSIYKIELLWHEINEFLKSNLGYAEYALNSFAEEFDRTNDALEYLQHCEESTDIVWYSEKIFSLQRLNNDLEKFLIQDSRFIEVDLYNLIQDVNQNIKNYIVDRFPENQPVPSFLNNSYYEIPKIVVKIVKIRTYLLEEQTV